MLLLRATCRVHIVNDPRPALRAAGKSYVYAFLHAHQIATVIVAEAGTGAMVSRSADGELLVPSLRVTGVVPVRGSSRKSGKDKGGEAALAALIRHVGPRSPVYFAVDGPRGPRNQVRRGVAQLAVETGAAILTCVGVPQRRVILSKAWDRFQIPYPFTTIDYAFAEPTWASEAADVEGVRALVNQRLDALEAAHDPAEFAHVVAARRAPRATATVIPLRRGADQQNARQ